MSIPNMHAVFLRRRRERFPPASRHTVVLPIPGFPSSTSAARPCRAEARRVRLVRINDIFARSIRCVHRGARVCPGHSHVVRCVRAAVCAVVHRRPWAAFRAATDAPRPYSPRYAARTSGRARRFAPLSSSTNLPGLHYIAALREAQRHVRVLLHQQDGGALGVDLTDDGEDGLHDQRCQTERGLVEQQ